MNAIGLTMKVPTTHMPLGRKKKEKDRLRVHHEPSVVTRTDCGGLQTAKLFFLLWLCSQDWLSSSILRGFSTVWRASITHSISHLTQKLIIYNHFRVIEESREGICKWRLEDWKIVEEFSIVAKHTSPLLLELLFLFILVRLMFSFKYFDLVLIMSE